MSEEELINALDIEGRNEVNRITDEGRRDAGAILDEAEKEITLLREVRLDELQRRLAEKRTALVNRARLNARGSLLSAKYEVMEPILEDALEDIATSARYPEVLRQLFEELRECWDEELPPVVHVNPADRGFVGDTEFRLESDETVSMGVVFKSADGRVVFINTLHSRLQRRRKRALSKISKILFPG